MRKTDKNGLRSLPSSTGLKKNSFITIKNKDIFAFDRIDDSDDRLQTNIQEPSYSIIIFHKKRLAPRLADQN